MIIVLLLIVLIIILFSSGKLPPDSVVLIALIILVITGILTPTEAFLGFGSDFIIMLASIFIISASLQHNGVVEFFSNKLTGVQTKNYFLTVTIIMLSVGTLSAFMNNTTVAAVMVLPILGMCKKAGLSPSKYLMPMAFASLLGGTCTLIGTSTNIAGNNFLVANGMQPIGMFEFLPIGATLLFFSTLVFALIGNKILPGNSETNSKVMAISERQFYTHFMVNETSPLVGRSVKNLVGDGITFLKVKNNSGEMPLSNEYIINQNDELFFIASSQSIKTFYNNYRIHENAHDKSQKTSVAEIMVLPSSFIANSTIGYSGFDHKTRLMPVGIFRKNFSFVSNLKDTIIKTGDIIIVSGSDEDITQLRYQNDFIILTEQGKAHLPNLKKGFISLSIFIAAILLGSFGIVHMSIAFLIAVLVTLSFNVLPGSAIYSKVDWRLIILIGGMTAFGTAIKKTGADIYLADHIVNIFSGSNHLLILFAFMVLTVLLTQPMSNAAAALVILPIALQSANSLGANPRSFAIAIILSASISLVTPFEPASLLVMNPGNYKISHFFKIGGLLTLSSLIIILILVASFYQI
ncbi:SLC13 family permease [soil metagenome]